MDNAQQTPPKVSVLLPVYNGEGELLQTVDCILNQTFSDFELLMINDASTDGTWQLMQDLRAKDHRIRIFEFAQNSGIMMALNRLAAEAVGDILIREDCGDLSHPDRYLLQHNVLQGNPNAVACVSDYWRLEEDGTPLAVETVPPNSAAIAAKLRHGNNLCHSSLAIRKDAFIKIEGYDEEMYCSQDYDLLLKLLKIGSIIPINHPLVAYRFSPSGITFRNLKKQAAYAELARVRAFGGTPPSRFDYDPVPLREAQATYHRVVGRFHLAKGRTQKARKHFKSAMEKGPSDFRLRVLYGLSLIPGSVITGIQKARGKTNPKENQTPFHMKSDPRA